MGRQGDPGSNLGVPMGAAPDVVIAVTHGGAAPGGMRDPSQLRCEFAHRERFRPERTFWHEIWRENV